MDVLIASDNDLTLNMLTNTLEHINTRSYQPGKGTEFTLRIPIASPLPPEQEMSHNGEIP